MPLPIARAAHLHDLAPVEVRRSGSRVVEARTPYLVPPATTGSLADLPFRNAAEAPDAVVVTRRTADGRRDDLTAAVFAAEVAAVAKGLVASGIGPGDRIVLMCRTRYEWTLLDFAAWAAGAAVVPVYPTSSAEQAEWIVRDSGAAAVVAEDADCAEVLAAGLRRIGGGIPLWRIDEDAVGELAARGAAVADEAVAARRAALTPRSEATLIYTSGTTGRPKGCRLTHGNLLDEAANCQALLQPVFEAVSDEPPSTLLFLPLSHVLGRMIQVACVHARIRIGHSPSLKPAELRPDLASFGATFLVGVPYLFEKIHHLGRTEAQARHAARVYDRAADVAVRHARAELAALAGEGPRPRSACGCSTGCTTRWSTAGCGRRWAAGSGTRSAVAPRSRRNCCSSSPEPGCWSTRATASPRPPARRRSTRRCGRSPARSDRRCRDRPCGSPTTARCC